LRVRLRCVARRSATRETKRVEDYRHEEATRPNNPPAGLAWQDTDKPAKQRFEYERFARY
jgi:hypothetical protein